MLYLFNEDHEKKLRKANMNEEGFQNFKKIADFFGVEYTGSNELYKRELAMKLKEKFATAGTVPIL